jgi:Nif-specific regulatory protein
MNMNYGTLTLLNRKTGDILIEAAHGLSPQQARRGRYKLGEGVTGKVVLTGEPAVIPKSESPLLLDNRTRRGKGADTSFMCVPIKRARKSWAPSAWTRPTIPTPTCRRTPACSASSPP